MEKIHFRFDWVRLKKKIKRWTGITESRYRELHIFCDASELAYGAVAYEVQDSTVALVAANSRVAPNLNGPLRSLGYSY